MDEPLWLAAVTNGLDQVPDPAILDASQEFIKNGSPWALCFLLMCAIVWLDWRGRRDAKEAQVALEKANAAHMATLAKAQEKFDELARQMAANTATLDAVKGRIR